MKLYLFLSYFIFISFFSGYSFATENYNLDVFVNASENFTINEANGYKVIVTNNETAEETVFFALERKIFMGDVVVYEHRGEYDLKKSMTKSYQWTPRETGGFRICAQITDISVTDTNESDNRYCIDVLVESPEDTSTNHTDENQDASEDNNTQTIPINETNQTETDDGDFVDGDNRTDDENQQDWVSCDMSIDMDTEKFLYDSLEGLGIRIEVHDMNHSDGKNEFILSYRIEDLFGNVIRNYQNNYSIEESEVREYNPKAPEISGSEAYIVRAEIINSSCNDTNHLNDQSEKMIVVKGSGGEMNGTDTGSYISIEKISDETVRFGDAAYVEIKAYRGDISKYSVSIRIERPEDGFDVSERFTMHLKDKNTEYSFRVPVQIKPNCDSKYNNGDYIVVAEGFDITETEYIRIEGISGSNCKTETKTVNKCDSSDSTATKYSSVSSQTPIKTQKQKEFDVEFVSFDDYIVLEKEFSVVLDMKNNKSENISVIVYSYVISGKMRLSEGLSDDGKWVKSWTGNQKQVNLSKGETIRLKLTNRVMKNITGNFSFRVKVKGDIDEVFEREIIIVNESMLPHETDGFNSEIEGEYEHKIGIGSQYTDFYAYCGKEGVRAYIVIENRLNESAYFQVAAYGTSATKRGLMIEGYSKRKIGFFGNVQKFDVTQSGKSVECVIENTKSIEMSQFYLNNKIINNLDDMERKNKYSEQSAITGLMIKVLSFFRK